MEDRSVPTASTSLEIGHELMWYRIDGILGRGGFGITYLSNDKNLDRTVAIKEYLPTMFAHRNADFTVKPLTEDHGDNFDWGLKNFLNEAQTLARFKHKNIVQVHTVFQHYGTAYMVMEYERGDSLASLIQTGRIGTDQAYYENILFPVMDGLQFIHDAGFIHRDIKPANIFMREDHSPVLIDFGSARQTSVQSTGQMTALVSQGYTPLEQYSPNFGSQGPWTDVYAFAASIYHAIAGKMADDSLNRCAAMQSGNPDPLIPVSSLAANRFTPEFIFALDQGLLLSPKDRPQSLSEWREMFEHGRVHEVPASLSPSNTSPTDHTIVLPLGSFANNANPDTLSPPAAMSEDHTMVNPLRGHLPIDPSAHLTASEAGTPSNLANRVPTPMDSSVAHSASPKPPEAHVPFQENTKTGTRGKTLPLVGGALLLAMATAGGWWFMQPQKSTAPSAISSIANTLINTLPRPESPVLLSSPTGQLESEISAIQSLSVVYKAALALDPSSAVAQEGLNHVADRYQRLAQAPLVQLDQGLRQSTIDGLQSSGVNEDKISRIKSDLENGPAPLNLNSVELLLKDVPQSSNDRQHLLFAITSLSKGDRESLADNSEFRKLTSTFKKSIITQLQNRKFTTAARMTELALLATPSDPELELLKAHLQQHP